jgi:predicted HAD superfamily phosphohydrolase
LVGYSPDHAGVDVEGPFQNPKADFAWQTYEILSPETKETFPLIACKDYDSHYDDGRYFHDLNRSHPRHATGMFPQLSLALAGYDGKTDEDLIALAEKTKKLNPGATELMEHLLQNFGREVYPITSSYSAVSLIMARDLGIRFDDVISNGRQHWKRASKKDLVDEVKARSPMRVLSEHRVELEQFLVPYLKTCETLGQLYITEQSSGTEEAIRTALGQHNDLFESVANSELKDTLKQMFLTEKYVMGSHRKVDAMRKIDKDRREWVYIGDRIVDAMPIEFANYGLSINMKDKHALSHSKLNVATTDVSTLIPVFDSIIEGNFYPNRLKRELDSEKIRVFTPHDIQSDIDTVVNVNGEMKDRLKAQYTVKI